MISAVRRLCPAMARLRGILRRAVPLVRAVLLAACAWHAAAAGAEDLPGVGAKRPTPLAVGDMAPDFTLTDSEGHAHTLSADRGRHVVILVFYRGYW